MLKSPEWKIVNPLEIPEWDDAVASRPFFSFFLTATWARVLCESYRYRPQYFVPADGSYDAVLPFMEIRSVLTGRRGVSLPFTDYFPPLFDGGLVPQEEIRPIARHGRASGWKYIEFRNSLSFSDPIPAYSTYYGHHLDLSGTEEEIHAAFRDSTKRNIRKAAKEGVTAAGFTTEESIREFFRLNCLTRREHGLPPQPLRFFKKLYELVISKGLGFVVLASYKGRNIAGLVCFHSSGKAMYKYGASDRTYQQLRANNLVMWEAIRLSKRHGCRNFCFGRTEPDNQGLLQFKSGWGAAEHTIRYYRYDPQAEAFVRDEINGRRYYTRIFGALPISLSRAAGEIFYRHAG